MKNNDVEINEFLKTLTNQRFERYFLLAQRDMQKAMAIYDFNSQISQSLYIPLQGLEIALRNKINHVMLLAYGKFWFDKNNVILLSNQKTDIQKVKDRIKNEKRKEQDPVTHDRVIAGLTFGFWVAVFSPVYDEEWKKNLHKIVIGSSAGVKRKTFSSQLKNIRDVRNRIAHHECILNYDLEKIYDQIIYLTGLISPSSQDWIDKNSSFFDVIKIRPSYEVKRLHDTHTN